MSKHIDFDKLDELLESKYEHDYEDIHEPELVADEEDGFNDETFGDDLADIKGKDFDFGAKNMAQPSNSHHPQHTDIPQQNLAFQKTQSWAPQPQHRPPNFLTVEELEQQMRRTGVSNTYAAHQNIPMQMNIPAQQVLSVAELEATFLANQRHYQQQQFSHMGQHMYLAMPTVQHPQYPFPPQMSPPNVTVHQQVENNQSGSKQPSPVMESSTVLQDKNSPIKQEASSPDQFPPLSHHVEQKDRNQKGVNMRGKGPKQVIYSTTRQQRSGEQREGFKEYVRDNRDRYDNRNRNNLFSINRSDEDPFAGLMTPYEKENIAKMQLAQLVTEDPERDDFYYQIYKTLKEDPENSAENVENKDGKEKNKPKWKQMFLSQATHTEKNINLTRHLRLQMQKVIQGKQKQKKDIVALEGALGKISMTTNKNPRQAIQVNMPAHDTVKSVRPDGVSKKNILKSIENLYECVLNVESLVRRKEETEEWIEQFDHVKAQLWLALECDAPVPYSAQHPTPSLLLYPKGKKIMERVLHFLTFDQLTILFGVLLSRFECTDVAHVPLGTPSEDVELFMKIIIPSLVEFISEAAFSTVNSYVRIVLERHNIQWIARSKVGLAIMTMLLSRAEILKQSIAMPDELAMWSELYNFLFSSLHTKFASVFSPTQIDEVYSWQFLSAVAVGATSIDHQRILVTEVRQQVIETAKRGDESGKKNVDLFLNALGLGIDAEQLAAMEI